MSYQSLNDRSNVQALINSAQGGMSESFKTFKDQKIKEAREVAGDVFAGTGGELSTQAIHGTIKMVTKTAKATAKKVAPEVSDLADGALDALQAGRGAVARVLQDPVGQFAQGARQVLGAATAANVNPGADAALTTKQALQQRYQGLSDEGQQAVKSTIQQGVDNGEIAAAGEAKDASAVYQRFDQVSNIIGKQETAEANVAGSQGLRNAGQVIGEGAEQRIGQLGGAVPKIADDVDEVATTATKVVSKGSKLVEGLDAVAEGSAAADETPLGLAVTAVAGIGAAIIGGLIHRHKQHEDVQQHIVNTRPSNFSYQQGI